jgi:hypothetical protein
MTIIRAGWAIARIARGSINSTVSVLASSSATTAV